MLVRYILKRILQTLLVLFFVSIFAFGLIRLAKGNPARMMLPEDASEEQVHAMEIRLGLDKPIHQQYFIYISGVLQGDLGTSTIYKQAVADVIATRLPVTGTLTFWTILVCLAVSIPLGIIAGSRQGTAMDFLSMLFALFGQSMSPVWLGILLIYVFSSQLGWLPAMGYGGIRYVILPAITLGYPVAAEITRIGRSGMIDVLKEDYITATYAKGISKTAVLWKYAFKNALIPIITLVGVQIGVFLAGTVVVETIFSWSGLGQLVNQAVSTRDYQLVQSSLLVIASMFALINLVVDIINSIVDPRITLK